MRGDDPARAGGLEDLRRAVDPRAGVRDVVEVRQPVAHDRLAVAADAHLAAVAVAEQHADGVECASAPESSACCARRAPRRERAISRDGWIGAVSYLTP